MREPSARRRPLAIVAIFVAACGNAVESPGSGGSGGSAGSSGSSTPGSGEGGNGGTGGDPFPSDSAAHLVTSGGDQCSYYDGELHCLVGGGCFTDAQLCDGVEQCSDGSDEEPGCADACEGFTCSDGTCVAYANVCDGAPECPGADDENPDFCRESKVCDSGLTTDVTELDACLSEACCAEWNECTRDGLDVLSCVGCLNSGGGELCDAVLACSAEACGAGAGICDSGIGAGTRWDQWPADACLGEKCCAEFDACTSGGEDVEACEDCLAAGSEDLDFGPLCAPAFECAQEECSADEVCDAGFFLGDATGTLCLAEHCCDPFTECTRHGQDTSTCLLCIEAGGGPLCDAAMACNAAFCDADF